MIIGVCSICGGDVDVPGIWHSTEPAPAICRDCGAVKKNSGPVIDMFPNKNSIGLLKDFVDRSTPGGRYE